MRNGDMRMIVVQFLTAEGALMQDFVNPSRLSPPGADRKMNRFGNGENPHLAQFDSKSVFASQTGFQSRSDLFQGDLKRAGREEGKMAASFTSRLYFLAEAFDETSHRLRNVSHQREGINSGSFPA